MDPFRLVGMRHLPPLPGIPNYRGTPLEKIVEQAVADADTLTAAGFTHLLLQNASDVPAQTTVAAASPLPLGINVAHNGSAAASTPPRADGSGRGSGRASPADVVVAWCGLSPSKRLTLEPVPSVSGSGGQAQSTTERW